MSEQNKQPHREPLTEGQALAIATIAAGADGGCSHCAEELAIDLARKWPQHNWSVLVRRAGGWEEEDE